MYDCTPSLLCPQLKYFVFLSVFFLAKQYIFGQEVSQCKLEYLH